MMLMLILMMMMMMTVCRSGLVHVGDRILAVDGVPTRGKSSAEVACLIASNRSSHVRLHKLSASAAAARRPRQRHDATIGQQTLTLTLRYIDLLFDASITSA